jgi:hypothetical protein
MIHRLWSSDYIRLPTTIMFHAKCSMSWSRACNDKFHTENVTNGAHSEMQTEQCSVSQPDEDTAATAMHLLPRIKVRKLMLMWNRVSVNHASSLPNSAVQTWALTLSRIRPWHQDPKITTSPRKWYSCQIAKEHIFVKRHSCHGLQCSKTFQKSSLLSAMSANSKISND